MMHRPDLLLLDEATVGLDLGSRESVVKIVRDLVAKERLGVLWATHQMDEVMRTDQVVVLHKGVVLFNGTVPNLLSLTGATSVREAFRSITGTAPAVEEAA
jgi:ABC-2 type transport system ATP-binding protein